MPASPSDFGGAAQELAFTLLWKCWKAGKHSLAENFFSTQENESLQMNF